MRNNRTLMKLFSLNRITLPVALLAVGAFCPELHAGWGSIQGNNRSAGAPMQAAAPRPQSQPGFHPQQQPAFRPEPQPAFHPQPSPMIRPEPPRQGFQPAPEQSHPAEHFQPAPAQVDRTPAGEADRRHTVMISFSLCVTCPSRQSSRRISAGVRQLLNFLFATSISSSPTPPDMLRLFQSSSASRRT
jgi:hypothetical protein